MIPFPNPTRRRPQKVSTAGGIEPVWACDEQKLRLFYRHADQVLAIDGGSETDFDPAVPKPVFKGQFITHRIGAAYDVGLDGRFLMIESDPREAATQVNVILNWASDLKGTPASRDR